MRGSLQNGWAEMLNLRDIIILGGRGPSTFFFFFLNLYTLIFYILRDKITSVGAKHIFIFFFSSSGML